MGIGQSNVKKICNAIDKACHAVSLFLSSARSLESYRAIGDYHSFPTDLDSLFVLIQDCSGSVTAPIAIKVCFSVGLGNILHFSGAYMLGQR